MISHGVASALGARYPAPRTAVLMATRSARLLKSKQYHEKSAADGKEIPTNATTRHAFRKTGKLAAAVAAAVTTAE